MDDEDQEDFDGQMVALFNSLRQQGFDTARNGLWLDLLHWSLNGAADSAALAPIAKRHLKAARRITELLFDEYRRSVRAEGEEPLPEEADDMTDDEKRDLWLLKITDQNDAVDGYDAAEILQDLAHAGVSEIHARIDRGVPRSTLPRFAAVLRKAIGSDALLSEYIDPETGEVHSNLDDTGADEMVDEGDPNRD